MSTVPVKTSTKSASELASWFAALVPGSAALVQQFSALRSVILFSALLAFALSSATGLCSVFCPGPAQPINASILPKKQPDPLPAKVFPLRLFGYNGSPAATLLIDRPSISTINYLDATHLLISFPLHRLLSRETPHPDTSTQGAQPGSQASPHSDQIVRFMELSTETGEVVLQKDIRLHDRARYLWPLGEGKFLFRTEDHLERLDGSLDVLSDDPPPSAVWISSHTPLVAVETQPETNLLIVENKLEENRLEPPALENPAPKNPGSAAADPAPADPAPATSSSADPIPADAASASPAKPAPANPTPPAAANSSTPPPTLKSPQDRGARSPLNPRPTIKITLFRIEPFAQMGSIDASRITLIPGTDEAVLEAHAQPSDRYRILYRKLASTGRDARPLSLAEVHSTCLPSEHMIGHDRILIRTCWDGGEDLFGLKTDGTLLWRLRGPQHVWPDLAIGDQGRRFAIMGLDLGRSLTISDPLGPEDMHTLRVEVFDTEAGSELLTLHLTPAPGISQVAAISPDGNHLAVLRAGDVAIYDLPAVDYAKSPAAALANARETKAKAAAKAADKAENKKAPATPQPAPPVLNPVLTPGSTPASTPGSTSTPTPAPAAPSAQE